MVSYKDIKLILFPIKIVKRGSTMINDTNVLTIYTKVLSVLVVESEYKISEKFFNYLNDFFKSVTFENDEKLIYSHFESTSPDILIADLDTEGINIFHMIKKMRKINPHLQIIIFSDKQDPERLIKCIKHKVSAFLDTSCTLIQLKNEIQSVLNDLFINNENIFQIEKNLSSDIKDSLNYLLENKDSTISLVNNYKGVPIIKDSTLVKIEDDKMHVKIENINKYTLKHLKHAVFTSIHLNKEIYADLLSIDKQNNIAIFNNLNYIDSYVHNRKHPRVEPCEDLSIILEVDNRHHKLEVKNFSLNYILFASEELPKNFKVNHEVRVHINLTKSMFSTPTNEKHYHTCNAQISEVFKVKNKYKILVHFNLEDKLESLLKTYINKRSAEIIKEFKSICIQQN